MKKIERLWANSGTKTAPSTAKQDTGWVDNEQVPYEWLNWLQDKVEDKINEVIQERLNSYYDDATDYEKMITTQIWDDTWGNGNDSANMISGGSAKGYTGIKTFFNSDGDPRLIVLDSAALKFEVWDPRDMSASSPESISGALSSDLPSPAGSWTARALCTDGTYVYAVFSDSASPYTVQVQAWSISTWSVRSGWGTGTSLTGTISADSPSILINANDTYIAATATWNTITAASTAAIQLINKSTGVITASGAGDAPTGVSAVIRNGAITSDGTNLFFLVSGPGNVYLCSATIANPQVGTGGSGYPVTYSGCSDGRVLACGEVIITSLEDYVSPGDSADLVLTVSTAAKANIQQFNRGVTEPLVYVYNRELLFDGLNLWFFAGVDTFTSTPDRQVCAFKIPIARFGINASSTYKALSFKDLATTACEMYILLPKANSSDVLTGINFTTFDGRDIWFIPQRLASATYSGKIVRLPLAILR